MPETPPDSTRRETEPPPTSALAPTAVCASRASRRAFVATAAHVAGAAALTLALPRAAPAFRTTRKRAVFDLVLRNGTVYDGRGAPPVEAHIGITDGQIVAIARDLADTGRITLDVRGLAVAPGFVDIHSHGDDSLFLDPRLESVVRQGITTIVVGADGGSRAPVDGDGTANARAGRYARFADFFSAVDALPPAVNIASMIGLGTLRRTVIGEANRPATSGEIAEMTRRVAQALDDGACGASSGLEYTPGAFATAAEMGAVCAPLRARQLPYATHMRNEDDALLEAIDEAIAVAQTARCPLQVSHLKAMGERNWPKMRSALERLEAIARDGLTVGIDVYPYIAASTTLANLFPAADRADGAEAFIARLEREPDASRLRAAAESKVAMIGGWDRILIAAVANAADRGAEGQRVDALARRAGRTPYEVTVDLLRRNLASVQMIEFMMREADVARALAHPLAVVCSDGGAFAVEGPARRGRPHPRGLGAFPRVLGQYVREQRALSLTDAITKMSSRPADRVGLRDRGRLVVGAIADVVVFDPGTVRDRATYEDPFQYPVGIRHVIVNGQLAVRDGEHGPTRHGRSVRPVRA
ncbi:MAG: D-aminoacylase [Gemmatimonadaceae bacterium]|nr:D-aminoacylase [Gemmatimonadaceae bacterium]